MEYTRFLIDWHVDKLENFQENVTAWPTTCDNFKCLKVKMIYMQFLALLFQVCFQLRAYIAYLHRTVLTWGGDWKRVTKNHEHSMISY